MKRRFPVPLLSTVTLLTFALLSIACRHTGEPHQKTASDRPPEPLAFIATVHGKNALELYVEVHSVLKRKGIRAYTDRSVGFVFSVEVPERDASAAVNAIAHAPELKGKFIKIRPEYSH